MGKISLVLFFAALSSVLLATSTVQAQKNAPNYAQALEKLRLYSPEDPSARKYLGLKDKDAQFFINQIDAEILIIEIFSMYCPHCQKHAPEANRLFEIITGRKDLKDRLKLIGIGVGNSPFEVKIFRENVTVRAKVFTIGGFSAHADQRDLLEWIGHFESKPHVFVVHG
ncbi:MAG: MBL fold metallo-hydrolase RNA specificity domain-containing protein, partial [Desulfomonilia bacterium]|nr:MBL fold metallo-hydrolase RNA specificity domain-containing protein [Desulfomonilia bacterium]